MAGFTRFLRLEVKSLYFWLYKHSIKPDGTVSRIYYIYGPFISMLLISLYSLAWKSVEFTPVQAQYHLE
jgi:hypothetical protein